MQTNLPTRPTQGPIRGVPFTRGNDVGSSWLNRVIEAGSNASPAMSGTTPDRSRIAPVESRSPGFSCPAEPYLRSLMYQFPAFSCQLPAGEPISYRELAECSSDAATTSFAITN